jgi:hypothetical protein
VAGPAVVVAVASLGAVAPAKLSDSSSAGGSAQLSAKRRTPSSVLIRATTLQTPTQAIGTRTGRSAAPHGSRCYVGAAVQPGATRTWIEGRKVARLPARGTLIFATDLQGNYSDYEALKRVYWREHERGHEPVLLLCGDLVHGPGKQLARREHWPDFLGSFYEDRSADLVRDFIEFSRKEAALSLLGNHEHAHIGGPVVSKFHPDEAAVLDAKLGEDRERVHAFFRTLPLIAVAPCGAVFTHGAPRRTEPDLDAFEQLSYDGFDRHHVNDMHDSGTVGALLWSRGAEPERARELLRATSLDDRPNAFVAYGHDVVREGFEKVGDEQLCISTSFGCVDENKHYLRLDLSKRYRSVHELELGREILPLHP